MLPVMKPMPPSGTPLRWSPPCCGFGGPRGVLESARVRAALPLLPLFAERL
jgi:hypothetical protein